MTSYLYLIIISSVHVHRLDNLDVANLVLEVLQLLLGFSVLLSHLLVLGLPLVAFGLKSLYFAFEVAGLDIGLAEPVGIVSTAFLVETPLSHSLIVRLAEVLICFLGLVL